jgi:hypothetical protein
MESEASDVETMRSSKYPKDVRQWKGSIEFSQLDQPTTAFTHEDYAHESTIVKGTTRRDARIQSHKKFVPFTMQMELEAHVDHLAQLRSASPREYFYLARNAIEPKTMQTYGLDEPDRPCPNTVLIKKKVDEMCRDVIAGVREQKKC